MFITGTMLIGICSVYTVKSVKMLVLCRGGKKLSITSFGFFNRNITTTIPLEKVSTYLSIINNFNTVFKEVRLLFNKYCLTDFIGLPIIIQLVPIIEPIVGQLFALVLQFSTKTVLLNILI